MFRRARLVLLLLLAQGTLAGQLAPGTSHVLTVEAASGRAPDRTAQRQIVFTVNE
jgi:hypothetical protein